MKKTDKKPISRERLVEAVQNTYMGTRFLVGTAVGDTDFTQGLARNNASYIGKKELLKEIGRSDFAVFPFAPGGHDLILISKTLYVWAGSINRAQRFPETPDVDGFEHCCDRGNAYFDVFYRIDHEAKKITFALGDQRRELPIREHSGWAWKLSKHELLCNVISDLERNFRDKDWNPIAVHIGRKALHIKDAV